MLMPSSTGHQTSAAPDFHAYQNSGSEIPIAPNPQRIRRRALAYESGVCANSSFTTTATGAFARPLHRCFGSHSQLRKV